MGNVCLNKQVNDLRLHPNSDILLDTQEQVDDSLISIPILIDATASMEPLISNKKFNLRKCFLEVKEYLRNNTSKSPDCFELMFIVYIEIMTVRRRSSRNLFFRVIIQRL